MVVAVMSGCSPTTSPVGIAPNRVCCHRGWQWHLSHSSWSDDLSGCYPVTWLFGIAPNRHCLGSGINIDPHGMTVFSGTSGVHWSILMERQFSVAPVVRTGDIVSITLPINVDPRGTMGLSGTGRWCTLEIWW